MEYQIKSR